MNSRSTPLVSIVIPTYNRCRLLQEAVASCIGQTYPRIEVVIVDDGSTDGTCELVAEKLRGEWAGRVVHHAKPNGGVSSARNLGMRVARGDYLQFLDSDDVLRPEKISLQMAAIQTDAARVDCCLCYGRLGDLGAGWGAAPRISQMCPDVGTFIRRECERTVHIMPTVAPLWRKEFLSGDAAWREDLSVAEEWEYYIRLLSRSPQCVFVEEELFWVRAHEGEQLSKAFGSLRHSASFYHAIRAVEELLKPTPFWTSEVRAGLLRRARTVYINLLRHGDNESIREFERWFLKLARATPNWSATGAVYLRQVIGQDLFLTLFDILHRPSSRATG
jgi:glycosyltransferase involved in cell wall biosynthesis